MERLRHSVIAPVTLIAFLFAGAVPAEIYRWVDEHGNVHFGDRPRDPERAAGAAPLDVQENYRPPQRTPEEQAAREREVRENFETSTRRLQHAREAREEERAAQRERRAELCAGYRQHLDRLSGNRVNDNGRLVRSYLSENGRSLTVREQEDYLHKLRAEMVEAGCE